MKKTMVVYGKIYSKIPVITPITYRVSLKPGENGRFHIMLNELTIAGFRVDSFSWPNIVQLGSTVTTYRVCIARMAFNIFNHMHTYGFQGSTCSDLGSIQIFVATYG